MPIPISATWNAAGQKRKSQSARPRERKKLIPNNTDVLPPDGRANDILHELRRLASGDFRNAVSVLFRVFLEFSVEEYMTRRAVLGVTSAMLLLRNSVRSRSIWRSTAS